MADYETTLRRRWFPRRPLATHGHGLYDSHYTDRFRYWSYNEMKHKPWLHHCKENPIPNFHIRSKKEPCFDWEPGHGVPRPQSNLIRLQDTWSKTEATRKVHEQYPEVAPHVKIPIQNLDIFSGKAKHMF